MLYSFDYRRGLRLKRPKQHVAFFQQHWAFFLGECIICWKASHMLSMAQPTFLIVHAVSSDYNWALGGRGLLSG